MIFIIYIVFSASAFEQLNENQADSYKAVEAIKRWSKEMSVKENCGSREKIWSIRKSFSVRKKAQFTVQQCLDKRGRQEETVASSQKSSRKAK